MNKKTSIWLLIALFIVLVVVGFTIQYTIFKNRETATIYIVPAITDNKILPTFSISSKYISKEISITAAPSEYEPASFIVYANQPINSLEIISSDLNGESATIPSSDIDIRIVKNWYQAGESIMDITHKILTPELLLKDDTLVKVEDGENYLKLDSGEYIWISNPIDNIGDPVFRKIIPFEDFSVQDSSDLLSVNITKKTNKQFWVTVRVPEDIPAGTYEGKFF